MFKNRAITVTVDKKDKNQTEETSNPEAFKKNTDYVLRKLESLGAKMFLGVCVYIYFDTKRQVAVAKAIYDR